MSSIFEDAKTGDIFICENGTELVFMEANDEMVRLLEYTKDKDYTRLYNFDGTHITGEDGYTIVKKKSDKRRSRDWWAGYCVGLTDAYMALQEIIPTEEKENIIKEFRERTGF